MKRFMAAATLAALALATDGARAQPAAPAAYDEAVAKADCGTKWGTDFAMLAFCVKQRREGHHSYSALLPAAPPPTWQALKLCERKWGQQWDMVEFCGRQQIEAYGKVGNATDGVTDGAAAFAIMSSCREKWLNQWDMIEFCGRQQAEAWKSLNQ